MSTALIDREQHGFFGEGFRHQDAGRRFGGQSVRPAMGGIRCEDMDTLLRFREKNGTRYPLRKGRYFSFSC